MKVKRIISAFAALAMSVSCLAGLTITASAESIEIDPVADTYIDSTNVDESYSDATDLNAGKVEQIVFNNANPGLKNPDHAIIFKFDVTDYVGKVTGAKLKLKLNNTSTSGGRAVMVLWPHSSWEKGATWDDTKSSGNELTWSNSGFLWRTVSGTPLYNVFAFPYDSSQQPGVAQSVSASSITSENIDRNTSKVVELTDDSLVTYVNEGGVTNSDRTYINLIVIGVSGGEIRVASKESTTDADKPKLVLDYSNQKLADYTIQYVDEGGTEIQDSRTARGVVGEMAAITDSDKADIRKEGKKYIYTEDDASTTEITDGGAATVKVKFREAQKYAYELKENVNNTTLSSGEDFEGDTVTIGYPEYIIKNEDKKIYKREALKQSGNGKEFGYDIKIEVPQDNTPNNKIAEYTLDASRGEGVFYSEFEDLVDSSDGKLAKSDNQNSRTSNRSGATVQNQNDPVTITTLAPGKYKITVGYAYNKGTTFAFNYGETAVPKAGDDPADFTLNTNGSRSEETSAEFTVTKSVPLTVTKTTEGGSGVLDMILVEKTADLDPVAEVVSAAPWTKITPDGEVSSPTFEELTQGLQTKIFSVTVYDDKTEVPKLTIENYDGGAGKGVAFDPGWKTVAKDGARTFYVQFMATAGNFEKFGKVTATYGEKSLTLDLTATD